MSDLSLIEAVKAGDYAQVETLLAQGADVSQRDEQGWTPLNFAAGRGHLPAVKLLVENGADIFAVGRDRRTPYDIALAAGRVSVVKYLREMEDQYPGEKPTRPERKYCRAYHLEELRQFPVWEETRTNWKKSAPVNGDGNGGDSPFPDDKVVFIHQDLTVTESVWYNENVIFNKVDSAWKDFCTNSLNFKVPDDLDLIVPNESTV